VLLEVKQRTAVMMAVRVVVIAVSVMAIGNEHALAVKDMPSHPNRGTF